MRSLSIFCIFSLTGNRTHNKSELLLLGFLKSTGFFSLIVVRSRSQDHLVPIFYILYVLRRLLNNRECMLLLNIPEHPPSLTLKPWEKRDFRKNMNCSDLAYVFFWAGSSLPVKPWIWQTLFYILVFSTLHPIASLMLSKWAHLNRWWRPIYLLPNNKRNKYPK